MFYLFTNVFFFFCFFHCHFLILFFWQLLNELCSERSKGRNEVQIWYPCTIVPAVKVQALRIRALEIPDAHQYHWNFHGAVPEPPPQKKPNYLRHKYPRTFSLYRFNQSVQSPPRHLESVWRRKFFLGFWNSSMEVLMILVRIRIIKYLISSCLNYYKKNYAMHIQVQTSKRRSQLREKNLIVEIHAK